MRVFIGVTTIAFVAYSVVRLLLIPREPKHPGVAAGVFWGALSGFTSTICQAGGPPYQMYVLGLRLPKMTYVGTNAIVFAFINWLKVVPYFALGQFTTEGFGTTLALLPLAIAANIFGFWLVRVTPQEIFYRITLGIMLVISIELTREGMIVLLRH